MRNTRLRDQRPRVAVVYPIPFDDSGSIGGGERFALELTRALGSYCDAELITIGGTREHQVVGETHVEVHRALWRPQHNNPLAIGFIAALRHVDVIHCTSYSTLLTDVATVAGRTLGKKVFITDIGGGGSTTLSRVVDISRLATGILPLSRYATTKFAGHHEHLAPIGGGVDAELFRPDPTIQRSGVVYVGRLLPHKGIDRLIDAIGTKRLTIVGRPMDRNYLAFLRSRAEGRDVTFVTDADDPRVVHELQSALIAVQPTALIDCYGHTNSALEFFGLSIAEAMACGAAVVCSDLGAHSELVDDGVTGVLVTPDDPTALAKAIDLLIADPVATHHMGEVARERIVSDFTWDAVARRCLDAYGFPQQQRDRAA